MAVHDTIGDFLTIIRNASAAGKSSVVAQYSKMRLGVAQILKEEGYILKVDEIKNEHNMPALKIQLKYVEDTPAIAGLKRYSTPGRRLYTNSRKIPRVLDGLGTAIITTSRGIVSDRTARKQKIGGEIICKVW